jgi:hypothetical protein
MLLKRAAPVLAFRAIPTTLYLIIY